MGDAADDAVEVWDLTEGADEPVVLQPSDTLGWKPEDGGPELQVLLGELLAEG